MMVYINIGLAEIFKCFPRAFEIGAIDCDEGVVISAWFILIRSLPSRYLKEEGTPSARIICTDFPASRRLIPIQQGADCIPIGDVRSNDDLFATANLFLSPCDLMIHYFLSFLIYD